MVAHQLSLYRLLLGSRWLQSAFSAYVCISSQPVIVFGFLAIESNYVGFLLFD
jgi:hypothetical protein